MLQKAILILGGLIIAVLLISLAGYYYIVRLPLPKTNGDLTLRGLRAPVEVFRDKWGVPHIYAGNEQDLFTAQGFVQAQDRLWQLEMNRRLVAGRLSEILGPVVLPLDRLMRTWGFMRAAEQEVATYDAHSMEVLDAFSNGVNACVESLGGRLPLEFRLLNFRPEPWRPEHSIAWAKFIALTGGKNWQEEIVRALLVKKLGREKAAELLEEYGRYVPEIDPGEIALNGLSGSRQMELPCFLQVQAGASNNWAVHGSKTVSGSPLLANDMHLSVSVPSVWYESHLAAGDLDVAGLSIAGIPLIIAGHNQNLAWGITFAYTDVQDLRYEEFSRSGGLYLHKGEWTAPRIIQERIRVKGREEPVIHEIRETVHGPILSLQGTAAEGLGRAFSITWSAHLPGAMLPNMYRMNSARDWEEFKAAALEWTEPAINLVYADREGNIGYVLASRIPIRGRGHGIGPFPGWSGEDDWQGFVGAGEKPVLLNPPENFIVTANNDVVGPGYAHYLAADYASGYRASRIEEVLAGKEKVSVRDCAELQGDLKSSLAVDFLALIPETALEDPAAGQVLGLLRAWDGTLDPDSPEAAIYAVLYDRLLENTFRDELGDLTGIFLGRGVSPLQPLQRFVEHSRVILIRLMEDENSAWFDDIRTPGRENFPEILEKSLLESRAFLEELLGPDMSKWGWGKLHQIEIKHPLGRRKPLDRIFNLGPFKTGGHLETVWQFAVRPGLNFRDCEWTASNRHIYDLGDWDRSLGMIVPGQSGMYGSRHYGDQVDLWLGVGHHPLHYSREKVESESEHLLVLKP